MVPACIVLGLVLIDQLTKTWASSALLNGRDLILIPGFLRLFYTENRGAAFSFLAGHDRGRTLLITASILGTLLFAVLLYFDQRSGHAQGHTSLPSSKLWTLSLALLLGGTVGNLMDRLRLGYVVDFIAVNFGHYTFPVFNFADTAIVIGTALMILCLFKDDRHA